MIAFGGKLLSLVLLAAALIYLLVLRRRWSNKLGEQEEGLRPASSLILSLRNQEKMVEGLIRDLMELALVRLPSFQLVVVDLGSHDDTVPILARLVEEYPSLEVICLGEEDNRIAPELAAFPFCQGRKVYHLGWPSGKKPRQMAWQAIHLLEGKGRGLDLQPWGKRLFAK